jgi:hypothetical protein
LFVSVIVTSADAVNVNWPSAPIDTAARPSGLDLYTPSSMTMPKGTPVWVEKKSVLTAASTL